MDLVKLGNIYEIAFLLSLMQIGSETKTVVDSNFTTSKYETLKKLVELTRVRISYAKPLARHTWRKGLQVSNENRDRAILKGVERGFRRMFITFGYDEYSFFVDVIQGARVIEFGLLRNWYDNDYSEGKPATIPFSVRAGRHKMVAVRTAMIKLFPKLLILRELENCHSLVTKAIHEVEPSNELYLRGLQRSFGNYCKKQINHGLK